MAVDGSVIEIRDSLSKGYYGKALSPVDILVKHEGTSADSAGLKAALKKAAK